MKKSIMLAATLAVLANGNPVHADVNSGSSSWSPRDINTRTIPGEIFNLAITRFTNIEVGTIVEELETNGEKEAHVMATIDAEGTLFFFEFGDRNLKRFLKEGEANFIPFKVSMKDDGSYETSVGAFKYVNNERIDNTEFWGWISLSEFELYKNIKSDDKLRGLKRNDHVYLDVEGRIGLYQDRNSDHNLFLKVGASAGDGTQDYLAKDGRRLTIDGNMMEASAGLHYSYGAPNEGMFEIGAGIKHVTRDGDAHTQLDYDTFELDTMMFDSALLQHEADLAQYEADKKAKEQEVGYADDESMSEESYEELTGIAKPIFGMDDPVLGSTELKQQATYGYGMMKYTRYLERKNIQIGFSLDVQNTIKNEITGSDFMMELQDENQIRANFEIKF